MNIGTIKKFALYQHPIRTSLLKKCQEINWLAPMVIRAIASMLAIIIACAPAIAVGDDGIDDAPLSSVLAGSTLIAGSQPLALNAMASVNFTPGSEQRKIIKNIVWLRLFEETPEYVPGNFTATVTLKIRYGASATVYDSVQQVFTVTYNKDEGTKYNAKKYFSFDGAAYVQVIVMGINAPVLGSYDTKKMLIVENEMRVRRYYQMSAAPTASTFTHTPPAVGADELNVSWSWPSTKTNTHTQLEWTWVEDELITTYYIAGVLNETLLFRDNSTRLDLPVSRTSYNIPLLYGGVGKLYFRIRPININQDSSRSDGPWSVARSQAFAGHDSSLNWQVSTVYAEDGKRKTVMQYFDGALNGRQTVTKDNTTDTTLIAETMYDYEGRPAVQILPAPGMDKIIKYTTNLNRFAAALNEDPASYFDLQPISSNSRKVNPLINTSGTSQYYSANNIAKNQAPNQYIPDAEGYPFTVTRYTPDGSGRILAQSGVGSAMQMGKGHETKYYYGSPAQEELDGLFGTEVGNKTHYFKNMVQDPNGQMSVSYVDMHGRTIATALAGKGPANMDSLVTNSPYYVNQNGSSITRNLLDTTTNTFKSNTLESINSLLVPVRTDYQFRYELQPPSVSLPAFPSGTVCYDCMYNLEISITDESGDAAPIIRRFNNINLSADDNCATPAQVFKDSTGATMSGNVINILQTLDPGSYNIRKTLSISESSLQNFKEQYLIKGLATTEQQVIDSVYTILQANSPCGNPPVANTCSACTDSLGSYSSFRAKYITNLPGVTITPALETEIHSIYSADSSKCVLLCATTAQTNFNIRQLMLADMVPYSGQYASLTAPSPANGTSMYNKYNIFSTVNGSTQPFYKKPWNVSKAPDFYKNAFGVVDPTIHPTTPADYVQLNATSGTDYSNLFIFPWAEALLPHHPEYDRLRFAEDTLGASYNWISTFAHTPTYTAGYIFTNSSNLNDPFFAIAPASVKADMVNKLSVGYRNNLSIWQIAYGEVKCKTYPDTASQNNCYRSSAKIPPYSNISAPEDVTRLWLTFRNLYGVIRDSMVNAYISSRRPLGDATTLVNERYILHFPDSQNQLATQIGNNQEGIQTGSDWSWYPSAPGGAPGPITSPGGSMPTQTYTSRCGSYVNQWKQWLLQCPTIANHVSKDAILQQITDGMVLVCQKGSDQANSYGASNVVPATPVDGSPRSFEDVINKVFAQYGIAKTDFCNPYVIEYPKPYGKGPVMTQEVITSVDSCNCGRFSALKTAANSSGYNPASLSSFNQYLLGAYGDTLTSVLFNAMTANCSVSMGKTFCRDTTIYTSINCTPAPAPSTLECGCTFQYNSSFSKAGTGQATPNAAPTGCTLVCTKRLCSTTPSTFALSSPQPFPDFLKCGSTVSAKCVSCALLSTLVKEFKDSTAGAFNAGPIFTGTDLTQANINDNLTFQRFINYRTGFQYTWPQYAQAAAASSPVCNLANYLSNGAATQNVICGNTKPLTDTVGLVSTEAPCVKVYNMSISLAQNIYQIRKEALLADFEKSYRSRCMAVKDSFTVTYNNKEYHYTLYYYDMAGSLVKTVPPAGVRPNFAKISTDSVVTARKNGTTLLRNHLLPTLYRYNSLGQVVAQKSPDADSSRFWYDRLGRLVVSQNGQQLLDGTYSYTRFDVFGRIIEVGQKPHTTPMTQVISRDTTALQNWIITTGSTREQLTLTYYDLPYTPIAGVYLTQRNLRSRVSYTATKNLVTDADPGFAATYYTYDVQGNVDTLLQDYKGIPETGTTDRFKKIAYDFDLVSGKVNMVSYQAGASDAFYHRYQYDAENRLTSVETSRDQIAWETDARYSYYKHGPLSRSVLGTLQVQGMDYAYTLQGWLKGVNGTSIGTGALDIGKDGYGTGANAKVARDMMGFALHYYDTTVVSDQWNDYKAVDNITNAFARPASGSFFGCASLYNGNIGAITVNNAGLLKGVPANTNSLPLFYKYRYDQLNRIRAMQAFRGLRTVTNVWDSVFSSIQDYKEAVSYDPNGNILSYKRKGAPMTGSNLLMDSLNYNYYANTNQLKQVTDDPSFSGYYPGDIDNHTNANNYTYDKIGNLKTDVSEGITSINWNVYGKITSIVKGAATISYTYDAAGNRISKTSAGTTTLYVRDASGSVMSVYTKIGAASIKQTETYAYGSNRLGVLAPLNDTIVPVSVSLVASFGSGKLSTFTRGDRSYEMANHLGNVMVTVTDRKVSLDANSDGIIDYYKADVASANDYYPFGMAMPGRSYSAGTGYRYGFNGKEKDDEVSYQDYGYRLYSATGRFLSVDPLRKKFPMLSPYQFAGNNPVRYVDLDGLEPANNPKSPAAKEKVAMVAIDLIETGAAKKDAEDNFFSRGTWLTEDDDINGIYACGKNGRYVSDTKKASADKFNMYVENGATMNVDESQADHFNNYESFVVHRLLSNFVSGEGAQNYNFPTNGIISSKFLTSDVLRSALKDFNSGKLAPGEGVQYSFGLTELTKDTWRNGTIFNITGLTGSALITITPVNEQGVKVQIFNITSLTSGDLLKNPSDDKNWPKSYVRDPDKTTPYGNISQTYNLFIPWSSPLLSQKENR